jgi:PAS domain-containing protein
MTKKPTNEELVQRVADLESAILNSKKAEAELIKSEINYRLLAETTREIILTCDLKGRITYVNNAGLEISGFQRGEEARLNISAILPPDQHERINKFFAKRIAGYRQLAGIQPAPRIT